MQKLMRFSCFLLILFSISLSLLNFTPYPLFDNVFGVPTSESAESSYDYALDFDGTGDYVSLSNVFDFQDEWTIALWFKTNSIDEGVFFSSPSTIGGGAVGIELKIAANATISVRNANTLGTYVEFFSKTTLLENCSYFIAVTYNVSVVKLFLNGIEENNASMTGDTRDCGTSFIGAFSATYATNENAIIGSIDEVRILNYPLSATEIVEDYDSLGNTPIRSGTAAWYKMNEGTGAETADISGNGKNGLITEVSWTDGFIGDDYALDFDGSGDYVQINSNYDIKNQWTVELWVILPSLDIGQIFSIPNTIAQPGIEFSVTPDWKFSIRNLNTSDLGITITNSFQISKNTAYFVAGTYDGSVVKLYVNGIEEASASMTGDCRLNHEKSFIGAFSASYTSGINGLAAQIDEVRVLDQALTYTDIYEDFLAQGQYPTRENTVGWYHLNGLNNPIVLDSSGNYKNGSLIEAEWTNGFIKKGFSQLNVGIQDLDANNKTIVFTFFAEDENGEPLENVFLEISNSTLDWAENTDTNGEYNLTVSYTPLQFSLEVNASKRGYLPDNETFTIYIDPPAVDYVDPVSEINQKSLAILGFLTLIFIGPWIALFFVNKKNKLKIK